MKGRWSLFGFCITMLAAGPLFAHELRPAFLEIRETEAGLFDALWKVPARGELQLALYVRLPESCEVVREPTVYDAGDAFIERWKFRCDDLADQTITIDGLSSTLTDVLIRIQWLNGTSQTSRIDAARPFVEVEGTPSRLRVAATYTQLGIEHILLGIDHLFFVVGLMLIVRDLRGLVKTITAFTIAHSVTLALAVFGVVTVPAAEVDAAIALSIVFLGVEVLHTQRGRVGLAERYPWIVAFAFGLLHGLGFAGALTNLGLPASDIPLALLFFNVGVEIGQLLFVATFLSLAWSFKTLQVHWPRWSYAIPAYVIGTLATYWFIVRVTTIV